MLVLKFPMNLLWDTVSTIRNIIATFQKFGFWYRLRESIRSVVWIAGKFDPLQSPLEALKRDNSLEKNWPEKG